MDRITSGYGYEEHYMEDLERRMEGESKDMRVILICMPLANKINQDLKFTTEVAEEFETKRLPTLDF